jgi:LSD1 subclass zinc finger protein
MLVECKKCGAPLDVNGAHRFVRCSYCDSVNRVRTMHTLAPQTPAQWQPPPSWQPPPQFGPFQPFQHHSVSSPLANRLPLVIIGFVFVMGMSGLIPFVVSMLGNSASTRSPVTRVVERSGPTIRTIDLARSGDPLTVVASGSRRASAVTGRAQCLGYVTTPPQLQLSTRDFVAFAVTPASADAVLLIRTATGQHVCSTEQAPALTGGLPPGIHQLWVGVRQEGGSASVSLDLRAASARLQPSAPPLLGAFSDSREDITTVSRYSGTVEGTVDVSAVAEGCSGFVSPAPQLTVELMEGRRVAFAVERQTDELLLLIRTPGGSFLCERFLQDGPSARSFDLRRGKNAVWLGVADLASRGQYTLATRAAY